MTIRNLLLCLSTSAFVVVLASSPAFAQNTAITACAHKSTGALRLVVDASQCKDNESPVVWPGEDNVIAIGVNGLSDTKTVTVANLGEITVSCDAAGAATAGLATSDRIEFRQDRILTNGTIGTTTGATASGLTFPAGGFGEVILLSLHKSGGGAWKIDFMARPRVFLGPPGAELECSSAAVVTVLQ